MTTANERKAAERQRRKNAGLVRVEVWVKPEQVTTVKHFAALLQIIQKPLTPPAP